MALDIETPAPPVSERATLFSEALKAACAQHGADFMSALGPEGAGVARDAGRWEKTARVSCLLGLGEASAAPLAVALGWWADVRTVAAALSKARVTGAATGAGARAVWDVVARAGLREVDFLDVTAGDVRAAAGFDAPVQAPPSPPKPDTRAAIDAAFDRAGLAAGPLRVVAGRLPSCPPVRVLSGDPAHRVPLARDLGRRLRARGFSLPALAVCVAAELGVAGSSSWWRRQLGEAS